MSEDSPTDLELRASVESLEQLHEERRAILPRFAELAARFKGGQGASADAKRKQHRALVMKRIAIDQNLDDKFAENKLERMANSDVEHIAFCEKMEREFTEYVLLEFRITEITERIRNRETCMLIYNSEVKLAR